MNARARRARRILRDRYREAREHSLLCRCPKCVDYDRLAVWDRAFAERFTPWVTPSPEAP